MSPSRLIQCGSDSLNTEVASPDSASIEIISSLVLHAIHAQDVHRARIRHPAGARDQVRVARVAHFEPFRGTAGGGDHAQVHVGIVLAGLRIAFGLGEGALAQHIGVRKHRLAAGIELQVAERLRIGRPPEAGAQVQFLGIYPVGNAVAQRLGAVAREARLLAGGHVYRVEVPAAAERDHTRVGREFGVQFRHRRLGQLLPFGGVGVDQEQVAAGAVEHRLAIARELHAADARAPVGPIRGTVVGRHIHGRGIDRRGIDEQFGSLGGGVVKHQAASPGGRRNACRPAVQVGCPAKPAPPRPPPRPAELRVSSVIGCFWANAEAARRRKMLNFVTIAIVAIWYGTAHVGVAGGPREGADDRNHPRDSASYRASPSRAATADSPAR